MALISTDSKPQPRLSGRCARLVAGYRIINGCSSAMAVRDLLIMLMNMLPPKKLKEYLDAADKKDE